MQPSQAGLFKLLRSGVDVPQSTVSNRCMYYIEAIDGHCDCVEAQREMRLKDHQEE
jgi:hypothetical protein